MKMTVWREGVAMHVMSASFLPTRLGRRCARAGSKMEEAKS